MKPGDQAGITLCDGRFGRDCPMAQQLKPRHPRRQVPAVPYSIAVRNIDAKLNGSARVHYLQYVIRMAAGPVALYKGFQLFRWKKYLVSHIQI